MTANFMMNESAANPADNQDNRTEHDKRTNHRPDERNKKQPQVQKAR
jgi:hypothetical protein